MTTVLPPPRSLGKRLMGHALRPVLPLLSALVWFMELLSTRKGAKVSLFLTLPVIFADLWVPSDLSPYWHLAEILVVGFAFCVFVFAASILYRYRKADKAAVNVACAELVFHDVRIVSIIKTNENTASIRMDFDGFGVELRDMDGRPLEVSSDLLELPRWRTWTTLVPLEHAPMDAPKDILPGTVTMLLDVKAVVDKFGAVKLETSSYDRATLDFPSYKMSLYQELR